MKTFFDESKGDFEILWPNRVSRYDLVFKAPPSDPMQYGLPCGNGEIGALLWCDDRRVYIALNKCDLWDDAEFDAFHNWSPEEEEYSTVLRHGCRIVIDFGLPIFDTFYLDDFSARVNLKNGSIDVNLSCPFGKISLSAFVAYNENVFLLRGETELREDCEFSVSLERYGSRAFSHWYRFHRRDTTIGLVGTESSAEGGDLLVSHRLSTGEMVCALRPSGCDFAMSKKGNHGAHARAERAPEKFELIATIVSPFDGGEAKNEAAKNLSEATLRGWDELLSESESCWKEFWSRSFVMTDDDYLDNLWHLAMYYSNAGQRGKYPGRFINSLWNWNRDVQCWAFYFHWNQQQVYWGLNAAGHHELCESYLNYRFDGMKYSRADSKRLFGVEDGLFVSDVCDRRGCNSEGEWHNHTPVGEIALDFWRQYLYTGDREFLLNKALPYMRGAAKFLASRFEKQSDGKYHAISGTAYEGGTLFYDCITELGIAKPLFEGVIKALEIAKTEDEDIALYKDIAENLAEIKTLEADPRMVSQKGEIGVGFFKGKTVESNRLLSIGRLQKWEPEWLSKSVGEYIPQWSYYDGETEEASKDGVETLWESMCRHSVKSPWQKNLRAPSSHPQACMAPVFPMNAIGLKDKGTPLFDATVTTALTCRSNQVAGWDTAPVVMARLGLAEELDRYLADFPSCWQYYNNGFGHYGPSCVFVPDLMSPFRRDVLSDVTNDDDKFLGETYPFRHMGLEPLGVFSAAMNEMLLQSYDGVLRLVPALGKKNAAFKLHAVGGFEVMGQAENGELLFVAVKSKLGEELCLENPWSRAWCGGKEFAESLIRFETEAGKTYLFTPSEDFSAEFEPLEPSENGDVKFRGDGHTMLGLARSF